VLRSEQSSLEDDLGHVVVQQIVGVATEVVEGVEVALDQDRSGDPGHELDVAAAGVAEDHRESVEVTADAVLLEESEVTEVDLRLLAGVGLEPNHGYDLLGLAKRLGEPLHQVVAAGVPLTPNLLEKTDRGEWVLGEPSLEVWLVGVEEARWRLTRASLSWWTHEEERADCLSIEPELAGDGTDRHLLGGEAADLGLLFQSKHVVPLPHPLFRGRCGRGGEICHPIFGEICSPTYRVAVFGLPPRRCCFTSAASRGDYQTAGFQSNPRLPLSRFPRRVHDGLRKCESPQ
jgi:hypothetical protein